MRLFWEGFFSTLMINLKISKGLLSVSLCLVWLNARETVVLRYQEVAWQRALAKVSQEKFSVRVNVFQSH